MVSQDVREMLRTFLTLRQKALTLAQDAARLESAVNEAFQADLRVTTTDLLLHELIDGRRGGPRKQPEEGSANGDRNSEKR